MTLLDRFMRRYYPRRYVNHRLLNDPYFRHRSR